jgi:hypothetical protein
MTEHVTNHQKQIIAVGFMITPNEQKRSLLNKAQFKIDSKTSIQEKNNIKYRITP